MYVNIPVTFTYVYIYKHSRIFIELDFLVIYFCQLFRNLYAQIHGQQKIYMCIVLKFIYTYKIGIYQVCINMSVYCFSICGWVRDKRDNIMQQ